VPLILFKGAFIVIKITPRIIRLSLVASAFLYSVGNATAVNIDPFAFCTNSCKPDLCNKEAALKSRCKQVCEGMWEQVGSLQMSSSSPKFRQMEKGSAEKKAALYSSPIAQCLDLKEPEKKETEKKEPGKKELEKPKDSLIASGVAPGITPSQSQSNDICAAAIKKEMQALEHDKIALQTQNESLSKALEDMKRGS
jgi:hypothetical protein